MSEPLCAWPGCGRIKAIHLRYLDHAFLPPDAEQVASATFSHAVPLGRDRIMVMVDEGRLAALEKRVEQIWRTYLTDATGKELQGRIENLEAGGFHDTETSARLQRWENQSEKRIDALERRVEASASHSDRILELQKRVQELADWNVDHIKAEEQVAEARLSAFKLDHKLCTQRYRLLESKLAEVEKRVEELEGDWNYVGSYHDRITALEGLRDQLEGLSLRVVDVDREYTMPTIPPARGEAITLHRWAVKADKAFGPWVGCRSTECADAPADEAGETWEHRPAHFDAPASGREAQTVERGPEKPEAAGSTPAPSTITVDVSTGSDFLPPPVDFLPPPVTAKDSAPSTPPAAAQLKPIRIMFLCEGCGKKFDGHPMTGPPPDFRALCRSCLDEAAGLTVAEVWVGHVDEHGRPTLPSAANARPPAAEPQEEEPNETNAKVRLDPDLMVERNATPEFALPASDDSSLSTQASSVAPEPHRWLLLRHAGGKALWCVQGSICPTPELNVEERIEVIDYAAVKPRLDALERVEAYVDTLTSRCFLPTLADLRAAIAGEER